MRIYLFLIALLFLPRLCQANPVADIREAITLLERGTTLETDALEFVRRKQNEVRDAESHRHRTEPGAIARFMARPTYQMAAGGAHVSCVSTEIPETSISISPDFLTVTRGIKDHPETRRVDRKTDPAFYTRLREEIEAVHPLAVRMEASPVTGFRITRKTPAEVLTTLRNHQPIAPSIFVSGLTLTSGESKLVIRDSSSAQKFEDFFNWIDGVWKLASGD